MMQVAHADISCKSHNTSNNSLQSSTRQTFNASFYWLVPWHLHDGTYMQWLRAHSHEPTCIVNMQLTSFFYVHISEHDEQNILKLELALFSLKHNVPTKQCYHRIRHIWHKIIKMVQCYLLPSGPEQFSHWTQGQHLTLLLKTNSQYPFLTIVMQKWQITIVYAQI
jgi:hypothetical protein